MVNVEGLSIAMRRAIDPSGLMQRVADRLLELLTVVAPREHAFDQEDIDTLTRLAGYVSSAIGLALDLARLNAELLDRASQ